MAGGDALAHLKSLPPLPEIAHRALEDLPGRDFLNVLRREPALAGQIDHWAGSGIAARRGSRGLDESATHAGLTDLRATVLVFEVFQTVGAHPSCGGEIWAAATKALLAACSARQIAARHAQLQITELDAFAVGLFGSLGPAVLAGTFPKSWRRIIAQSWVTEVEQLELERTLLGADHLEAASFVCELWDLPDWLCEAARECSEIDDDLEGAPRKSNLVLLATLARHLARQISESHVSHVERLQIASELGVFDLDALKSSAVVAADSLVTRIWPPSPADAERAESPQGQSSVDVTRMNAELLGGNRRLASRARYFRALTYFDQQLAAWGDPAAVVSAVARSGVALLQRGSLAAFGIRESSGTLDLAWVVSEPEQSGNITQGVPPDVAAWLRATHDLSAGVVIPMPEALRSALCIPSAALGPGSAWLLPVLDQGRVTGGLLLVSEADETARWSDETEELRDFLESVGLALRRANAYTAAQRLAGELAENNRRLQQVQHDLLRTRSLAMIAEMAAGAGHELNNPLTVISGRAQVLLDSAIDPVIRRGLEQIREKAHECSRVVSEMMEFAKPRPPQLAKVEIGRLLAEIRAAWLAKTDLAPSDVHLDIRSAGLSALADPEQLKSVIQELLDNATDAVAANHGSISIACRGDGESTIEIVIADTGCGMAANVLNRAFDPFFSHRRAGRGRGLGLPRAARIIESHGGKIWLESQPDQGTRAHVSIPASSVAD